MAIIGKMAPDQNQPPKNARIPTTMLATANPDVSEVPVLVVVGIGVGGGVCGGAGDIVGDFRMTTFGDGCGLNSGLGSGR